MYTDMLLANAGHVGTVEISSDDATGAGEAHNVTVEISSGDPGGGARGDYREHLDGIVGEIADAMNPQGMPGGPFA